MARILNAWIQGGSPAAHQALADVMADEYMGGEAGWQFENAASRLEFQRRTD